MLNLLVLVGPTATGKSARGVELAKLYNGEVISGDSMQVYKKLDIGTAKITKDDMQGIKHHLIDFLEPQQKYSAAEFQKLAVPLIEDINKRNKLPIIVGGTGLYIQSVIDNYQFAKKSQDGAYRLELQNLADKKGEQYLYELLVNIDPDAASNINAADTKKIIRALEINKLTGKNKADVVKKSKSAYNLVYVALEMERQLLYERIEKRIDQMLDNGLLIEAEMVYNMNLKEDLPAVHAIGYKEFFPYFRREATLDECVSILKRSTRRYAKRQLTWFRRDSRIKWYQVNDNNILKSGGKYDV